MRYIERDGEVEVTGVADFDLAGIFECGQCFRWDADESGQYTGVAMGRAARLRREGDSVFISGTIADFESIWLDYFDLRRDYEQIRKQLSIDKHMEKACRFGMGLRILRQDPWEALCSFIISQCNNIPRIKSIIKTLCENFGDGIEFEGAVYYTFPAAERLAVLEPDDLAPLRAGYRAAYIIGAARAVSSGEINLDKLIGAPPDIARRELIKLVGVGNKVADCAMLFGLNILDAFPIDVWMRRAVQEHYGKDFDPQIFAPYAGIAQQYIFHYARNG